MGGSKSPSTAADIEARIARVASRQHGVVTRQQLLAGGLTVDMIRSRLRSGRLIRLHREVFLLGTLVGPLRPKDHLEMAAVLACGHGAVVSHRSALWLRTLLPARPPGPVHVTLRSGRCRRPGITAHRLKSLPATDVETVDSIPTTRIVRAILDVAALAGSREIERLIARAERMGLLDIERLRERVRLEDGRPGTPLLRAVLNAPGPLALTRSRAEERFLELVRKADLPEPECNVQLGRREIDFLWREHGVAVEVDGFAYHGSRHAFERDRARDLALGAAGVEVRRVTWRQIDREPLVVVRRLAATLARAEMKRDPYGQPGCRSGFG